MESSAKLASVQRWSWHSRRLPGLQSPRARGLMGILTVFTFLGGLPLIYLAMTIWYGRVGEQGPASVLGLGAVSAMFFGWLGLAALSQRHRLHQLQVGADGLRLDGRFVGWDPVSAVKVKKTDEARSVITINLRNGKLVLRDIVDPDEITRAIERRLREYRAAPTGEELPESAMHGYRDWNLDYVVRVATSPRATPRVRARAAELVGHSEVANELIRTGQAALLGPRSNS